GVRTGSVRLAWSIVFLVLSALFVTQFVYHRVVLPTPDADRALAAGKGSLEDFLESFLSFFRRPKDKHPKIGIILAFLLLFRFGEAQAIKLVTPFLLDSNAKGGLGLTTSEV